MTSSLPRSLVEAAPRIAEEVEGRRSEWIDYVSDLARMESPTDVASSQGPIQRRLAADLREVGFRVRKVPGVASGGLILASPEGREGPLQLLLGHTDTVWAIGTTRSMPVELDGQVLKGPGVFDMKAGLAHIVIALRALRSLGLRPALAPVVLLNSDEETGSRESTRHIARVARRVARVLVLEPALGAEGKLKTARLGFGRFSLSITGRAAHSGLDPASGASAIEAMARVVQALHAMTECERDVFVNVGVVRGGTAANVVAASATAEVDVRVPSGEEARQIEERIRAIDPQVAGCSLRIDGGFARRPMEPTDRNRLLWDVARDVGGLMGLKLEEGRAGGGSDGNTTSLTTATLDGLGGVGGGAHAESEHVHVDRSLERCALLAGLLLVPPLEPRRGELGTGATGSS